MKSIIPIIFLLVFVSDCYSQGICSGNLGENIFERGDFGTGTSPVLATDPNIAPGYNYVTSVPPDGSYTICSNTGALAGLYGTWLNVGDNSDDPNGYMMVVNASYDPGIFYEEIVDGLCENTLYEFSADILNIVRMGTPNHIKPNVSFLIDNEVVYSTGDIAQNEEWRQFGFSFVTDNTQTSVTLTLQNNAPGGGGNDLALDNISFRPCGPSSFIGIDSDTTIFLCIDDEPLTVVADIETSEGQLFVIQWQSSSNGNDWTTLEDSINNTIVHTDFAPGEYFYRYFSAGNEVNILNEKCRIISDEIKITILPDSYEVKDTICEGLVYNFGSQTITNPGQYVEDFQSQYGCDSIVFLELFFVSSKVVEIDVGLTDPSCFGLEDGDITVNSISGGNGGLIYSIFDSESSIVNSAFSSGDYFIEIEDRFRCVEVLNYQLVDPQETSVALGMDTTIRLGDELTFDPLYSSNVATISWSGQGEFDCSDCENPLFLPYFSGVVQVLVQNESGCEAKDDLTVTVDDENFVILPNIFSPNDDNINDDMTINYYGKSVAKVVSFSVFDRWGGVIHRISDVILESGSSLWDGYFGSSKAIEGVYTYSLEVVLVNGVKINKVGGFTLLK